MKVQRPLKEIRKRCKAEGIDLDASVIEKVLEYNEDIIFDKLIKHEEVRVSSIGKITPSIITIQSRLPGQFGQAYETVKFKFTAFEGLKSSAKDRLSQVKKKHL